MATATPNMPNGESAGARCANRTGNNECILDGNRQRTLCIGYKPIAELCGRTFAEAIQNIIALKKATAYRPRPLVRATT